MNISEIEFPDRFKEDIRNDNLVIFAGSGVSMGAPSNHPDFKELARQVASPSYPRLANELDDQYLGRVQQSGVRVHKRVREILSNESSLPTELHKHLLRWFPNASSVRIVTTNYDSHFTTASRELFETPVEVFYAPALPLGNDFTGIVHLHGGVEKEEDSLIITDGDFGRAYLTEGWASRFLLDMHLQYTVVYIGYSYSDTVMRYLSRGLPHQEIITRYIFTDRPHARWNYLGIQPIEFPESDYNLLEEAVGKWAHYLRMGTLDHETRIKQIVSLPPVLHSEDTSYIAQAISDPDTTHLFTKHTRSSEWLDWIESNRLLEKLFQTQYVPEKVEIDLAYWFSSNFVTDNTAGLNVAQNHEGKLCHSLWHLIARELSVNIGSIDPQLLAAWINVLLNSITPEMNADALEYLLDGCRYPEDSLVAIQLFSFLSQPSLILGQRFYTISVDGLKGISFNIEMRGDVHSMSRSWISYFRPNIEHLGPFLEPVIVSNLQSAHMMLRSVGRATETTDSYSYLRDTIKGREKGQPRDMDVLVDAARDLLDWILKCEPDRAIHVIEGWFNQQIPILKRLAIYGITNLESQTSNQTLHWILDRNLLFAYGLKAELFQALKEHFPNSDEEVQKLVLKEVEQIEIERGIDGEENTPSDYEVYNLLYWLSIIAPESNLAKKALESFLDAHSEREFEPRDRPDLSFHVGSSYQPDESPYNVEQLLSKDPADPEFIKWLLDYEGEGDWGPNRSGLIVNITECVIKNPQWSWALVSQLVKTDSWESDIWKGIYRGWQRCANRQEQHEVINFLIEHAETISYLDHCPEILVEWLRKPGKDPIEGVLNKMEVFAAKIRTSISSQDISSPNDNAWLGDAINDPAGKLAEFWTRALFQRRHLAGDDWSGLPEEYQLQLQNLLADNQEAAQYSKIIFVSQLHMFFALDAEWTRTHLIPLLDWSNPQQAIQVWDGYLFGGQWNNEMLPDLFQHFMASFEHLDNELSEHGNRMAQYVAAICVFGAIQPIADRWILKYMQNTKEENRIIWSHEISTFIQQLDENAVILLWEEWLREYWANRIDGIPVPITSKEVSSMVDWILPLSPVYGEIVDLICGSPAPDLTHTFLFKNLEKENLCSRHPEPTAKLLLFLLPSLGYAAWHCSELESLIRTVIESGDVQKSILIELCNELARLNCDGAEALRKLSE